MAHVINAVYEDGVFKPLEKVTVKEHKKVVVILESNTELPVEDKCSLAGIIDIAKNCRDTDLSFHHDKYLYGEAID